MHNHLLSGVPREHNYRSLIKSDEYKEMEIFSDGFLYNNRKILDNYSKKWVKDPLHQWSRQWEYPYVFNKIESFFENKETARILDAGSGITFFPYLIKLHHPSIDIYCADKDKTLESIYQQINAHSKAIVNFSCSDLKELPFEQEWLDIIYCVSVLEHTNDYSEIIDEFHRILRPGGRLVITFDVSLDGTRDINVENGNILLQSLADKFTVIGQIPLTLRSHINEPDLFTTHTAKKINPNLLPWRLPYFIYRLKSFVIGKQVVSWPPLLTVFCLCLEKEPAK